MVVMSETQLGLSTVAEAKLNILIGGVNSAPGVNTP
jgi:hypothetical protein